MGLFGNKRKQERQAELDQAIAQMQRQMGVDPASLPSMKEMLAMAAAGPPKVDNRYGRLAAAGVEVPGRLLAASPTGTTNAAGAEYDVEVRVEWPGVDPWDVRTRLFVGSLFDPTPGAALKLRVDPEDRNSILIWDTMPSAAPTGPDPLDALAALADRRDQGLIGEAEYEAERARLLSEM